MNEEYSDPMMILPFEIQMVLKRKSSRDPASRFASKLHILLTFVSKSNDPTMEEKIGCGWVSDDEFKLNKKTICQVLGIKINTLNVNLSALNFKQQKHNKNGWTLWKRDNFTRNSSDVAEPPNTTMTKSIKKQTMNLMAPPLMDAPTRYSFNLGLVDPPDIEKFANIAMRTWYELTNLDARQPAPAEQLIKASAERFKQEQQPLGNAIEVLQAIMNPTSSLQHLTFRQFAKLLAMFGPEQTLMLKIASLLNCSNQSGQWLSFVKYDHTQNLYGTFNDDQPNCLEIFPLGRVIQVWNMPLVDANGLYLRTQYESFSSWDDYFERHPLVQRYDYPQY